MGPALAASGAPASAVSSPGALHRQPHDVAAPIVAAYAGSLTQVFLWAAPVALVGFVLALFLREVPLRDIHDSTVDLGERSGCRPPKRRKRCWRTRSRACCAASPVCGCAASPCDPIVGSTSPGCGSSADQPLQQIYGTARLTDIANYLRLPFEVLEPTFSRPVTAGYARRDSDEMWLTPARGPASRLRALAAAGLARRQAGPLTGLRGPAGPSPGARRARARRASSSRSTRLA